MFTSTRVGHLSKYNAESERRKTGKCSVLQDQCSRIKDSMGLFIIPDVMSVTPTQ